MSKTLGLNVSLYISSLAQKAKAFKFTRHTHGCRALGTVRVRVRSTVLRFDKFEQNSDENFYKAKDYLII